MYVTSTYVPIHFSMVAVSFSVSLSLPGGEVPAWFLYLSAFLLIYFVFVSFICRFLPFIYEWLVCCGHLFKKTETQICTPSKSTIARLICMSNSYDQVIVSFICTCRRQIGHLFVWPLCCPASCPTLLGGLQGWAAVAVRIIGSHWWASILFLLLLIFFCWFCGQSQFSWFLWNPWFKYFLNIICIGFLRGFLI